MIKSSKSVSIEKILHRIVMKRVVIILVFLSLSVSCSRGPDLWSEHGAYVGSENAAIALACNNRSGAGTDIMAWKLCVHSQKMHYKK